MINRFAWDGIQLDISGGNIIEGNFIGTDVTGALPLANSHNGVAIFQSTGNLIGGRTARARNVISGNGLRGIYISSKGSAGNDVQGNYVGTDVTGVADLGNSNNGVEINNSPGNRIGAAMAGARNVISANDDDGVVIIDPNGPLLQCIPGVDFQLYPEAGTPTPEDQSARILARDTGRLDPYSR